MYRQNLARNMACSTSRKKEVAKASLKLCRSLLRMASFLRRIYLTSPLTSSSLHAVFLLQAYNVTTLQVCEEPKEGLPGGKGGLVGVALIAEMFSSRNLQRKIWISYKIELRRNFDCFKQTPIQLPSLLQQIKRRPLGSRMRQMRCEGAHTCCLRGKSYVGYCWQVQVMWYVV